MSSDAHGATVPAGHGLHHPYHLVNPSPWPIVGALGGFCTVFGIIMAAHFGNYWVLTLGAVLVLSTMFLWWRDVIKESRTPGMAQRRGAGRAGAGHAPTTRRGDDVEEAAQPRPRARASRPRAITMRWISLVPSPMIMSGASR